MTEPAPKKRKYTWQEVTNEPRGLFKVGDREFSDQDFTRKERAELMAELGEENGAAPFIVAVLNRRRPDPHHVAVTPEWLDEMLSDEAVGRVFVKLAQLAGMRLNDGG